MPSSFSPRHSLSRTLQQVVFDVTGITSSGNDAEKPQAVLSTRPVYAVTFTRDGGFQTLLSNCQEMVGFLLSWDTQVYVPCVHRLDCPLKDAVINALCVHRPRKNCDAFTYTPLPPPPCLNRSLFSVHHPSVCHSTILTVVDQLYSVLSDRVLLKHQQDRYVNALELTNTRINFPRERGLDAMTSPREKREVRGG